jgi:hypothetical protein
VQGVINPSRPWGGGGGSGVGMLAYFPQGTDPGPKWRPCDGMAYHPGSYPAFEKVMPLGYSSRAEYVPETVFPRDNGSFHQMASDDEVLRVSATTGGYRISRTVDGCKTWSVYLPNLIPDHTAWAGVDWGQGGFRNEVLTGIYQQDGRYVAFVTTNQAPFRVYSEYYGAYFPSGYETKVHVIDTPDLATPWTYRGAVTVARSDWASNNGGPYANGSGVFDVMWLGGKWIIAAGSGFWTSPAGPAYAWTRTQNQPQNNMWGMVGMNSLGIVCRTTSTQAWSSSLDAITFTAFTPAGATASGMIVLKSGFVFPASDGRYWFTKSLATATAVLPNVSYSQHNFHGGRHTDYLATRFNSGVSSYGMAVLLGGLNTPQNWRIMPKPTAGNPTTSGQQVGALFVSAKGWVFGFTPEKDASAPAVAGHAVVLGAMIPDLSSTLDRADNGAVPWIRVLP